MVSRVRNFVCAASLWALTTTALRTPLELGWCTDFSTIRLTDPLQIHGRWFRYNRALTLANGENTYVSWSLSLATALVRID